MKKLFPVILLIAGLTATHATAQTFMPAKQVTVPVSNLSTIVTTSNVTITVKSALELIDGGLLSLQNTVATNDTTISNNTSAIASNTSTIASNAAAISNNIVAISNNTSAIADRLLGTNIVDYTYNASNQTWELGQFNALPALTAVNSNFLVSGAAQVWVNYTNFTGISGPSVLTNNFNLSTGTFNVPVAGNYFVSFVGAAHALGGGPVNVRVFADSTVTNNVAGGLQVTTTVVYPTDYSLFSEASGVYSVNTNHTFNLQVNAAYPLSSSNRYGNVSFSIVYLGRATDITGIDPGFDLP